MSRVATEPANDISLHVLRWLRKVKEQLQNSQPVIIFLTTLPGAPWPPGIPGGPLTP